MMSMELDDRLEFMEPLLRIVKDREHRRPSRASEFHWNLRQSAAAINIVRLLEEVRSGKCILSLDKNGSLLRIVVLVVLRISNNRGQILVQVAEEKNGAF